MKQKTTLLLLILTIVLVPASYFYCNVESQILDAKSRANLPGQFVKLSQGFTHYEVTGPVDGRPLILVHGFGSPAIIWDHNFRALAEAHFRVVRFDLYGRGYSDRPNVRYDLDLFDRQLLDLIHFLNFKRVNLVGVSMGGAIIATFLDRHPELVSSICLIDTAGIKIDLPFTAKLARIPIVGEYLMRILGPTLMPKRLKQDFYLPQNSDELRSKFLLQMKFKGFQRAIISTLRDMPLDGQEDTFRRIGKTGTPVLIIWGKQDTTIPVSTAQTLLKDIPQAKLRVIERARHIPNYEQPWAVNSLVIDFLKTHREDRVVE